MNEITATGGGVAFEGRNAVELYRLAVLASALKLYALSRMQVNRAYTPSRMMTAAEYALGRRFKRGAYLAAAEALYVRVDELKAAIDAERAAGVN